MDKKEIQTLLNENKLILGQRETEKALYRKEISKILLASNAVDELRKRYEAYAKQGLIELEVLDMDSEELGVICKKPFTIMVIGIKNA
ncbi:ribosomal L7Ae/L30e/S12e/Gadd45 family protein [Candidatus Woesearchaeota archaeon]|nr:ribosomal L7Ae/L30e/S12e/Gadd45 family protein [Candidatus Woesearchaeota archaeon]